MILAKWLVLVFIGQIIFASPAFAYIDPGVGSMLLQALAAGAIAMGLFWRRIVHSLKKILSPTPRESDNTDSDNNHD